MDKIPPFSAQNLDAACKVLGDTNQGLTGSQIGNLLNECRLEDVTPRTTKAVRLFKAFDQAQKKHDTGNHFILFIERALNPVSYTQNREGFQWLRSKLNTVLVFSGFSVQEDGQVIHVDPEQTLSGAVTRAGELREKLKDRHVHEEIIKYCDAELLDENYFYAVFEAMKGVADRVRSLSGLETDGAKLFETAFSTKKPVLAINTLNTETDINEQKGFTNILIGLFGSVRNPTAHTPKIKWPMTEHDALDILSTLSFVHRKLDKARKC